MANIATQASKYVAYLSRVGEEGNAFQEEDITPIFHESFQKIMNGQKLYEGRVYVKDQLAQAKEYGGGWTIELKELIEAANGKNCTICYVLRSPKAGDFIVMAILHHDDEGKLIVLEEVFSPLTI